MAKKESFQSSFTQAKVLDKKDSLWIQIKYDELVFFFSFEPWKVSGSGTICRK